MDEKGQILFDEKGVDVLCRERSLLSKMGVWLPKQRIYSTGVPVLSSFRINTEIYGPPAIEFRDAYIGYDKKTVVRKLNLQVKKGEFVALVGRNGCGKSTVLQSLIGLSDLQSGSILIEGKKRKKELPAYLFQNPEHQFIYPTVAEEVSDSSVLRRHGLYDKRCQNPFTLSGGEKRRLSLVSLVGSGHSTYLLDEPTFGQDSKTACELVIVIKEFYKKGKTIVLVSHDLPLFRDMLTRVVVLKDGSVVFDGSAQELSGCTATQLESWGVEL
jgi:energy-coupling factor transport system ATP-binding protein